MHTHTYIRTNRHTRMRTHIRTYVQTDIHVCTHTYVPVNPAASAITNVEYERIMNIEVSRRGCSRNLDIFITKAVIIAMATPNRNEPMNIPKNFKMEMKTDNTYSSGSLVPVSDAAAGSYSSTALWTGSE